MKLGEYLVKAGLIDDDTLAQALEIQKTQRRRLGQVLVDMGVADEVIIAKAMDGIAKVMKGLTTIDEVFRAAPPDADESSAESRDQMDSDLETVTEEAALAEPEPTVRSASPNRILVVDDSAVVREMIRHNLEAEGYLIITAKDGIEALKTVSAEKPDLIVLDYLMPKMDGLKVIKELKAQLSTRFIPIIMLTAKDEIKAEVESLDAGADDYLTKPFVPERLLVRIKRLLNQ
ncbi:MAG: response regulator [Thermodesulfobacteriota bacterium]